MNEHQNYRFEDIQNEAESLVLSFHRVQSLVPFQQELVKIPPEMPVADALELMQKHRFSQLPVVAGDAVLGVFSYRSFSLKAMAKQKSTKDSLGDLPVEDFLEDFEYVHVAEDWNRVLRYLNQNDAFFVGNPDRLDGMVTTMDLLSYFQEIANPFIMLAEIELSLRQIIRTCLNEEIFPLAVERSLKTAYTDGNIPTELHKMTFDNFVQIISNGDNWPCFEKMFGSDERTRKRTNERLRQLGQWRNIVFHFHRRLCKWELETLAEYREWLEGRVRAFEGRRRWSLARESEAEAYPILD